MIATAPRPHQRHTRAHHGCTPRTPTARTVRTARPSGAGTRGASTGVVSVTSMAVEVESRGMPRPTVPNYALRRVVVGAALAVVAAVALGLGLVAGLGLLGGFDAASAAAAAAGPGSPAAASGAGSAAGSAASSAVSSVGAPTMHVARPGDTMWSIAATYRGAIGHSRYLDALIARNGTVSIEAGQAVWLP